MSTVYEQCNVRIQSISFKDFRNIEHGSITFPNSKPLIYRDGTPSILGLYGQNGSGKTSAIMALGILKEVLSGNSLGSNYISCVREGCDHCSLSFVFSIFTRIVDDVENPLYSPKASSCLEVFYDFDIFKRDEEITDETGCISTNKKLYIENEIIKYKGTAPGSEESSSKQLLFDTRTVASDKKGIAFGNKKIHDRFARNKELKTEFKMIKAISADSGKSFLFSHKFRAMLKEIFEKIAKAFEDDIEKITDDKNIADLKNEREFLKYIEEYKNWLLTGDDNSLLIYMVGWYSFPYNLLETLSLFGRTYLQVIDTTTTGLTNINSILPLLYWRHILGKPAFYKEFSINMNKPTFVEEDDYKYIEKALSYVSNVLNKLVPGLSLSIIDLGKRIDEKNKEEHCFDIISNRDGHSIPLRYESDGIRRMVSILSLLIASYNEGSFTVAIDEIDSGIFEYLLGELLSVMSESMKGQLIFTAHNLRPLEVLPSKYLCFTTTDKNSRFMTINKRGNSNLRDTYFRNIVLGSDKTPVYNPTDKYEIELALLQAGHVDDNEENMRVVRHSVQQ